MLLRWKFTLVWYDSKTNLKIYEGKFIAWRSSWVLDLKSGPQNIELVVCFSHVEYQFALKVEKLTQLVIEDGDILTSKFILYGFQKMIQNMVAGQDWHSLEVDRLEKLSWDSLVFPTINMVLLACGVY